MNNNPYRNPYVFIERFRLMAGTTTITLDTLLPPMATRAITTTLTSSSPTTHTVGLRMANTGKITMPITHKPIRMQQIVVPVWGLFVVPAVSSPCADERSEDVILTFYCTDISIKTSALVLFCLITGLPVFC